ncbi:hypothetical protein A4A49_06965 [Nicotiana attenuata]|uniref:Uncharacterized protein n=1 Tax=Nicotiana attenuata TaxID=49451 RepID=A0A314L508_NICAT|nr:hypothetical protein A4A49_06965 [Nicotiana attenuata]
MTPMEMDIEIEKQKAIAKKNPKENQIQNPITQTKEVGAVSGRPPPATSMGVGQFFNPEDGDTILSSQSLIQAMYFSKEMMLKEDHPLALNLSFSVSLGLMPVTLSVKTTGCGIRKSQFTSDESGEMEIDTFHQSLLIPVIIGGIDV